MNSATPIPVTPARSRRLPVAAAIVSGLASTAWARRGAARGRRAASQWRQPRTINVRTEFRKAAQSGPARGAEIYLRMLDVSQRAGARGGAPKLVGLFQRPTLVTGEAVNDDNVKRQILNGSADMPAYRHVFNDADIADLMSGCG